MLVRALIPRPTWKTPYVLEMQNMRQARIKTFGETLAVLG